MRLKALRTCLARFATAAVALVVVSIAPAQGQSLVGQPVQAIEFEGLGGLAAETLEFYLGVKQGEPYEPATLNDNLHRLWERELIDDISIEASSMAGGVKLVIRVTQRPLLRSIEYVGLKRVSRGDIVDRIAEDRLQVREGDALNLGDLRRLKRSIEALYREKGFRLAQARYQIDAPSPSERTVTFSIDEGDKVRIAEIDFEGNTVFGDRRLKWSMKKTKESGLLAKVTKKDVFNPATLDEDLDKIREIYHKAGYKNVVLGEPKTDVRATKPGAASPEEQRRRLFVTVPVEEGGRWTLGEIMVEGNETFSDELLLAQFEKPSGGWLRSDTIDKGIETINEVYQNTGHLFAQVQSEVIERDAQVADVKVIVEEGDQYSIGRIDFQGNRSTRDKVIRRELAIQEGMVLNSGALRNSLLRVRQLEFFKVDETDPVAFDFDNENKTVDLTIKGDEGDRTEMQFGAGFSEVDGFFGQFQFRSRNFLGRGETLGVSLQSGKRQDVFDLSYSIPWFLDRPQNAAIQVFSRKLDYDLLDGQRILQDTTGATLTYGRRLGLFSNLSLSYSFFDSADQRQLLALDGSLIDQDVSRQVSSLRLAYGFDRRDSRLQPTQGRQHSASVEYTGGVLGGDTWYVRPRASFSLFKPLTKGPQVSTLTAFNVEAGLIEPFGGRELFFLDRFYLGGENSMRGFRFRSIWVRDEQGRTVTDETGFPLGGDSFFQLNLEFQVLFGGPFRLVAFADAGSVFVDEQSPSIDSLRYSAGLELRVLVPIFGAPLRFIWAQNLDALDDDRFDTFQFSVGTTF
ncbi:MAG: outer membrane protein assembly factor BamA [Acidobacteriota bacterium]|nr:outer membrane protein assembly factor BamA [Acidobacteriota bacterium]